MTDLLLPGHTLLAGELVLETGAVAVDVPASWAAEVSCQLEIANALGPILAVPGEPLRWLFLAHADASSRMLTSHRAFPPSVWCWVGPLRLAASYSRWVVTPTQHRQLPPLRAIHVAIRAVRRYF